MNGIILGAGRIGFNLAKMLVKDHDITVIDRNGELCDDVDELLECYVIKGDGTDINTLEDASIDQADFFVATTDNDEVNLLSSVYAKDNGVEIIASKLNSQEHEAIFEKLGIRYANAETNTMKYIVRNITRPSAQTLISVGKGDAEVIEVQMKNNIIASSTVSEIQHNTNKFIIITVYDDDNEDEAIIPNADTIVDYDDSVVVLVKSLYVDEVRQFFTIDTRNPY